MSSPPISKHLVMRKAGARRGSLALTAIGIVVLFLTVLSSPALAQDSGWFADYVLIKANGGTTQYYWIGSDPTFGTQFNGATLPAITYGQKLELGADMKYYHTWQSRTGGSIFWKIGSGNFNENIWTQSYLGGNDYQGKIDPPTIDVAAGLNAGTHTISVYAKSWGSSGGDMFLSNNGNNYTATFTINKANQATVSGSLAGSTINFGSTTTVTASGGSGTGAYEFRQNGGTGTVSFSGSGTSRTISTTKAGTAVIEVRKVADTNYNDSAWVSAGTLTINKVNQAVLTLSPTTAHTYNTSRAYTIGGGSGTGALSDALKSGSATRTSALNYTANSGTGSYVITVTRAADDNYNARSDDFTITMAKASQTITFGSLTAKAFGDATFSLGATASSGLAVSYTSSNAAVATVSGSTVTIVGAGTTTITASQAGDSNFNAASSVQQTLTVNKASQTISGVTSSASKAVGDASYNVGGTASSGLALSYSSSNTSVATVNASSGSVTILAAGTTTITVSQAGNDNYSAAANATQTLTVGKGTQATVTGTLGSSTITFGGTTTVTAGGGSGTGAYEFRQNGGSGTATFAASGNPRTITGTAAGTADIEVRRLGDANYNDSGWVSAGELTIEAAAEPTISAAGSLSAVSTTYGTASASPTSFTVSGLNMEAGITVTPPAGFQVSTSATFASNIGTSVSPLTFGESGNIDSTTIYVRLPATTAAGTYSGNIVLSSTNATSVNVASVSSTVSPKALTITGVTAQNKVYDGNNTATLSGTAAYDGLVNGETFSVSSTPSATFADKAVGTGKTVTVTGYEAPSANYSLTQPSLTADITAKALTVTNPAVTTKTYDQTADATITGSLSGVIEGDTVSLVGTGTFATADAGDEIAVTSTSTLSGADAGNYSLTQPTGLTGDIQPKALTVTGAAVTAKVYDGTTAAVITGSLDGVLEGDVVTLSGTGTFASANVGAGIAVTSTSAIGGAQGGNYELTQPTGLTGNITAKPVTITGLTAASKTYDGNTTVSVTGTPAYSGLVEGDNFAVNGNVTWAFPNATAEPNKTLTRTGTYNAPSSNYSLTQPTLTASINPATITCTANARVVVYGDPVALVTGSAASSVVTGFVNNETTSVVSGSVAYTTTYEQGDVAGTTGRTITPDVSGLTATNYSFVGVPNTVTVLAIGAPTSFTAIAQGPDRINLGWTKSENRNALLVRRTGGAVTWTPSPGVLYSPGMVDANHEVLDGSTPFTHRVDSGRSANTNYHYAVFSESYKYYSAAATASATTAAAGTATYGMRDDAGVNLPRIVYSSSAPQGDQDIFGYNFDSLQLGTITSFSLKGASIKTFKNTGSGGDVTGTRFYYKIWKAGTTEPAYDEKTVGFSSNDGDFGNQTWADFGSAINLFSLIGDDFGDFLVKIEFVVLGNGTPGVTRNGPFTATFSRAAPPTITPSGTLAALSTTFGTASSSTSFTLSALSLTGNVTITPPAGFEVSLTENFASVGTSAAPLTVVVSGGTLNSLPVYVRLAANANAGTYSGNIELSGGDATTKTIATAESAVSKATQTITLDDSLAITAGGTLALPATASSGLTISYSSSNPSVATIEGNNVTAVGTGLTTITATQSGNTNYEAATTITRTLSVSPAPVSEGSSYIVTFEDGSKAAYASGSVTLSGISWNLTEALIATGTSTDDFFGTRSARLRGYSTSSLTMEANKANGAGTISFQYRRHATDSQVTWKVEYSTDNGTTWTQAGSNFTAPASDAAQTFSATVNVTGNVRFRIVHVSGGNTSTNRRLNIDDITITNYAVLPTVTTSGTLTALSTTYRTASTATTATVNGGSLSGDITATAPSGFEVSNNGTDYGPTATFTKSEDGFVNGTLYVRLSATATAGTKLGDIVLSTAGGNNVNLATAESTVDKATPVITEAPQASKLEVGQVLGDSNLTGGAATFLGQPLTDGTFAFANPAAEPPLGTALYDVVFVPTDTENFNNSAAVSVSVLVQPASTVIFSENIGGTAVATTTTMAAHIAATPPNGFENSPNNTITFSGNATIRATSASSGYTGASGGNNVYISAGTSTNSYTIAGIDTRGYTNLHVTFGHRKEDIASSNELVVEVSANGTDWTQLTYSRASGTGTATWALIQPDGEVPVTENLRVRFRQTSTSYAFRVDDVKVLGTPLIAQTITFGALSNRTYGDAAFELSASASSGLGVSFTSSDTNVATVDGNTVTIVAAGSTTITAIQAGSSIYAAAPSVQQTLTIDPKGLTIIGASATNRTFNGSTTVAITGGSLEGVVGQDEVTLGGSPTGSIANANASAGKSVTVTGYTISGTKAGNYSLSQPTDVTVDITKAAPTITAAPTASAITNVQALSASNLSGGTATGVDNQTLAGTFAFTSPETTPSVGTANQDVTFTPTDTTNYNTATTTVAVTVTSSGDPLPGGAFVDFVDGNYVIKDSGGTPLAGVTYTYNYTGRSVGGLTRTYSFLSYSSSTEPTAPGFYTVAVTAAGDYAGSVSGELEVAGPLALPGEAAIELTKIAGTTRVRLNATSLLGTLQRVTPDGALATGATGLTWTAATAGTSQMPAGYDPATTDNTVTHSSSFVTLTPPGSGASTSDSFTVTVSDGETPVVFPVTVTSTAAPTFDLQIRKVVPVEGDPTREKAIFLTRPNRTVELEFFTASGFVPVRDKEALVSADSQNSLTTMNGEQQVQRPPDQISTGTSGVVELFVPAGQNSMSFRAKPVIPPQQ